MIHQRSLALQIPYYLIDVGAPFSAAFRLIPGWHWVAYLVRPPHEWDPRHLRIVMYMADSLSGSCHATNNTSFAASLALWDLPQYAATPCLCRTKARQCTQVSAGAVCSLFTVLLVRAPHTFGALTVFLPHQEGIDISPVTLPHQEGIDILPVTLPHQEGIDISPVTVR